MTRHVIDPGLLRAGREAARRLQRNGMQVRGRLSLPGITQEEVTSLSGVLGARWRAPQAGLDATVELAALELGCVLPADPPMSLARFATAHCGGDPHALDRDRPLDAVLRRALAHVDGDAVPAAGAAARRELYDRWGLSCDELSATVLCCGLLPPGVRPLAQSLRVAAAAGEPRVLTLRELGAVTSLACGPLAFTCENPDVIAAVADALGPACPPLVCSEGWPSTACLRLLRALCAGGRQRPSAPAGDSCARSKWSTCFSATSVRRDPLRPWPAEALTVPRSSGPIRGQRSGFSQRSSRKRAKSVSAE